MTHSLPHISLAAIPSTTSIPLANTFYALLQCNIPRQKLCASLIIARGKNMVCSQFGYQRAKYDPTLHVKALRITNSRAEIIGELIHFVKSILVDTHLNSTNTFLCRLKCLNLFLSRTKNYLILFLYKQNNFNKRSVREILNNHIDESIATHTRNNYNLSSCKFST